MATLKVTDATFERDVLKASGPVLVDFWATWCGPCIQIAPILEQLSDEHAGTLTIAKLDVDESPRTAGMFRIQSIPTMILFVGGKATQAVQGAVPKAQLTALIEKWLPKAKTGVVAPKALAAELKAGAKIHLLDLREPQHFARSHLRHAHVVDATKLHEHLATLPPNERVVLVCRTGDVSKAAAIEAQKAGFSQVVALEKGLLEWEGAGFQTFSKREEEDLDTAGSAA